MSAAECMSCGERFGGLRVFERHRVGAFPDGRRCLTDDEMAAGGWHRDTRGLWRDGHRSTMVLEAATSGRRGAGGGKHDSEAAG